MAVVIKCENTECEKQENGECTLAEISIDYTGECEQKNN